ncbi:DUF6893 family small protein [Thermobispora bispora]|jgi:hypothetical protein|uniref:Uncharacterized protein n=1 Tax=Thermobispora bispora (strain ATCC 19993 / DSM 43833 / CBS 139.67 / JCM 10125 / KCTC 9307 / NBRC 14880 / R51) TaxID=469371 RepID=D6Y5C7_THEBD|nr:hypothetical protein Tbis_2620 [Thermobispora bispora DSM 43833]
MRKLRILGLLALCGVIVITAMEWPELKRYVKMTRM